MKRPATGQISIFRKNLIWISGGFILFVLVFPMVFGEMGFLQYVKMQKTQRAMVTDIERLKLENNNLEKKISRLQSDPDTIERVARGRLGLVRPGEVVFQLQGSGRNSGPPGP